MNHYLKTLWPALAGGMLVSAMLSWQALAFPPAPDHILYGLVRDEMGEPIQVEEAEVILETESGVRLRGNIVNGIEPGINYQLAVPLDSGVTEDLYSTTALRPAAGFRIHVRIGTTLYLPIEMRGELVRLGDPAHRTRLNLTLGEDADGDGLPDAWERALGKGLDEVNGEDDSDGDGLNNLDEYIAGTYAFDPEDGFALKIAGFNLGRPVLEFMAIRGRTYRLQGSSDMKQWDPVAFIHTDPDRPKREFYAEDVRLMRIEAVTGAAEVKFFKLLVE